jgi:hypothetical protein
MNEVFAPRDSWVLSGSLMSWGDAVVARVECVVFLALDPAIRLARLRERELARYGDTIGLGGRNRAAYDAFLDWARGYDEADFVGPGRSRARHEAWLAGLSCPVLRLNSELLVPRLTQLVCG